MSSAACWKWRTTQRTLWFVPAAFVLSIYAASAGAQVLEENFDSVTGTGGGLFHVGPGFSLIDGWDDGIVGENAFAGTTGNARFGAASAAGLPGGGLSGGGGRISVSGINYNLLDESFAGSSATGGGAFLVGDGFTPDTFNFTTNWDDGISGEGAFGGTFGGAILNGTMSAQAVPAGGVSGAGGEIVVSDVILGAGDWFAGLQWDTNPFPGASALTNVSFEGATGFGVAGWATFGNVFTEAITPRTGATTAKLFGAFPGNSGVFQDLAAQPGQVWELDVWSRHQASDNLIGTGNAIVMAIEFRDAQGTLLLSSPQEVILNAGSPTETWNDNAPVQATAPAGTVSARALFMFVQSGTQGGAGYLDDASFKIVGGPNPVDLSAITLTAAIKGAANGGAGESLGAIQLRLEDSDGDRLAFHAVATGAFQTIGGALSTAIEEDALGVPTPGVFDITSPLFRVVVAFDNDAAADWGTGGALTVDNVLLTNTNSDGSGWFAGLFWDDLVADLSNPSQFELRADVKGSVPGGSYALRLEAFKLLQAGFDNDFDAASGEGADVLLDPTLLAGGQMFGFTTDYDTGIVNDGAFGGVFGLVQILEPGGIFAEALTTGGNPGGAGQIRVENISVGPGGGWFAGLDFGAAPLASTDLSQVVLTADIKGTIPDSGGALGQFELRIEDDEGDRLYFPATATGAWQTLGGPLSTALEGPALGGGGDGTFDLDEGNYNVVVSFVAPETSWFFGGILTVDNLFLTPAQVGQQIGEISFAGTSSGDFQNIGGLLSSGATNLGDFLLGFENGTGTGGGNFGGGTGNWDDGIVNENAFFGTFGDAVSNVGASAQVCASCGVGGTEAAELKVEDVPPGTGGWFTGIYFTDVPASFGSDLSQIVLSADIRGTANAGLGETLGTYFLRIEDADRTVLSFTVQANGAFQQAGGPLSTGVLEQIDAGDGVFNLSQATYTITIGMVGTAANWGPGATLHIDNIFLTGVQLSDADAYTVTLTFADEVATWGAAGELIVDNLFLGESTLVPGDLDCNGVVDVDDIGPFALALVDPDAYLAGPGQNCLISLADVNGDEQNDGLDVAAFVDLLLAP